MARASESPPPRARLALRPPPQSTPEAPSEAVLGLASARPPALPRSGPPPIPGPRTPPPVPSKRPAPTKPPPLPSQRPERTPKPAASDDEASMLADVRVLAALSGSTPAQAPTLAAPLALPPTISPPSTPPPAHAPAARAPSLIMSGAILGGCALVAGALVAGAMLGRPPSDPTPAVPVAATEPVRDEPPPAPIVAAPAPVVAPAAPAPVAAQEGRASRSRSSRSRRSSTARAASDDAPVVRASSGASEASVERSTPEIAAPAPAPDVDLPEMPGRDSVVAAMERIEASVSACAQGEHGTAIVAIVVAGESGRVTSANVSGQFAGTPVGSCVARAVRNARFDRFERATFSVSYPFRL
ncbi:Basic proline-rich protein precursor [Sandaracinus amylolyticus]|uniref:Basic proline-rich protein n=1 Tax=Sandaracinus amylolyticus TaxID=927083 RepID=A0A0F6W7U3_9BACT|nr:Basic proline-rich protein precursor [Sandaracinus amylolyticus]